VIWVVTVYFTGFELGIIAIGIGALSGLGVRLFAKETRGTGPAMTALVVSLVSIGAAKVGHIVISWPGTAEELREGALLQLCNLVARDYERTGRPVERPETGWEIRHTDYPEEIRVEAERRWNAFTPEKQAWYLQDAGYVFLLNDELAIAKLALNVVEEYETQGLIVKWPPAANRNAPGGRDDFPEEIWQEAVTRWEGLSTEERREFEELIAFAFYFGTIIEHILAVFSLMDVFWLILAAATAWSVASSKTRIRLGRFGTNPTGDVLSGD
jgi:hypothetical protein